MRISVVFLSYLLLLKAGTAARALSTSVPHRSISGRPTLLANKKVCISGGGPCGIYLASLLLQNEPTVQITILERQEQQNPNSVNAFGIGLGSRLLDSLNKLPGLRERVTSRAAPIVPGGASIISRSDLSDSMTNYLQERDNFHKQCQIRFGEACQSVDLKAKQIVTTKNRKLDYDLLVGADGIRSMVRETLIEQKDLKKEHYLFPPRWKALRLPPQPEIEYASFHSVQHEFLRTGRVLPRYPEGHILLLFWDSETDNPGNITSVEALKSMLTDGLQDNDKKKESLIWRLLSRSSSSDDDLSMNKKRRIAFDENALELFLQTRPGRSHHMKIDRFHDDSVALLGDAAHGMSSLLGQGCACGLKSAEILADCLFLEETDDDERNNDSTNRLNGRLRQYSERAVPNAHAITDLNLISCMSTASPLIKILALPHVVVQKIRGRSMFGPLSQVDVSYEQILRENQYIIRLAKRIWKKIRIPVTERDRSKASREVQTTKADH